MDPIGEWLRRKKLPVVQHPQSRPLQAACDGAGKHSWPKPCCFHLLGCASSKREQFDPVQLKAIPFPSPSLPKKQTKDE